MRLVLIHISTSGKGWWGKKIPGTKNMKHSRNKNSWSPSMYECFRIRFCEGNHVIGTSRGYCLWKSRYVKHDQCHNTSRVKRIVETKEMVLFCGRMPKRRRYSKIPIFQLVSKLKSKQRISQNVAPLVQIGSKVVFKGSTIGKFTWRLKVI